VGSALGAMLACALCSGVVAVAALRLGYLRLRRLEL
jgi:hypothetical protein